jgi:hypothetical protein
LKGKSGWIKLTGKLSIPKENGCEFHDNCLNCPFHKCYLDMTSDEKIAFKIERAKNNPKNRGKRA